MNSLVIILIAMVVLVAGYVFYGRWLAKKWGIDEKAKTPAFTHEDGEDFVPSSKFTVFSHQFSSIAGAGPINGPIQASIFGWVPVFLWCIIGGIFFGGLQDFGSLFASIRHDGKSVGEIIEDSMGSRAKKLFIIFALLVLILVIASFVNIVAGTFLTVADEAGKTAFGFVTNPTGNQSTAMISLLFIVLAVIYGYVTNRMGVKTLPATIGGIIGIVLITVLGLNVGFAMNRIAWIVFVGVYIAVASLVPVWILLQPRDYLSSFLLYAMIGLAFIGVVAGAFTGTVAFDIPAFTSWEPKAGQTLFPMLFITVACGACSGFHSLIATGTSSKQLANEKDAKAIGYGSMLIESALGIIALVAVGAVYQKYLNGEFGSPAAAFAAGIASMFGTETSKAYGTIYALLTLSVSVFALTSLDTGTRLSRFMFSELFLKEGEATYKDAKGARKVLAHPLFGTVSMVLIGCILGGLSLSQIWGLFGAANQLCAALVFISLSVFLKVTGRQGWMLYVPMGFMFAATMSALAMSIYGIVNKLVTGAPFGMLTDGLQLVVAIALIILALLIATNGLKTLCGSKAGSKNETANA